MPGFDGTGPRGMGPMTGGGRGFCALPSGAYPRAMGQPAYRQPWGLPAAPFMPRAGAYPYAARGMSPWGGRGMGMGRGGGRGRGMGRGFGW